MKLIVYFNNHSDQYVNINADKLTKNDEFICAYNGNNLVGMFDVGVIMAIYLSDKGGN